jgi:hypothetical protein
MPGRPRSTWETGTTQPRKGSLEARPAAGVGQFPQIDWSSAIEAAARDERRRVAGAL